MAIETIPVWLAVMEAIIGGAAHELLQFYQTGDYKVFRDSWAYIALAAIAGFIWWTLGLPNHFNLFLVGFNAPAVISMLMKRTEKVKTR